MSTQIYAEIVVDNKCRETDRIYTYIIPEEFSQVIKLGCRVLVPFGISNKKTEAYVIGFKDYTDVSHNRLKRILKIIDNEPVLSKQLIELAKWIKDTYLCYYIEAIQTIVPATVRIKSSYTIELNLEVNAEVLLGGYTSEKALQILEYLELNNGVVPLEELRSYFSDIKLDYYLKKLLELNIIIKSQAIKQKTNKKLQKLLYAVDASVPELPKNAQKQKELYDYIYSKPGTCLEDLRIVFKNADASLKALLNKGLIRYEEHEAYRYSFAGATDNRRHELTELQSTALEEIKAHFTSCRNVLLHGVTGSGKTEIYLELIEESLKEGKDAIVLVPEIALTPQMISRFRGRFGDCIAVLHSNLSEGEKYDEWRKIRSGLVKLVVGARSAIFAPFKNLGIIIIDEEHEGTYKSDIKPKYLTREVADKRCQLEGARLVLGSATPSIETYYKAQNGEYGLVKLLERVMNRPMPMVEVIDMREELKNGNKTIFSERMTEEILHTLNNENQLILFLNRRGHSTFVSCRQCGLVMKCPSCSISLTYHMHNERLTCHYCGFERTNPKTCPKCSSVNIRYFGVGTQKLEKEFQTRFNISNTLRMDADTTSKKSSHEKILDKFRNKESNVLLGTQMISKGLDFHDVTLVGVITADTSMNLPDFRAAERTFQMIAQVAGRSGRGEKLGTVIVQTYSPDHYSIKYAKDHDYEGFYEQEIMLRRELSYPPFSSMSSIVLSGIDKEKVRKAAMLLGEFIERSNQREMLEVLGPAAAPLAKIKNRHRWQIIIKSKEQAPIKKLLYDIINSNEVSFGDVSLNIDMNPYSML